MPLLHFLLIYDHEQQRLVEAIDLGQGGQAASEAAQTYADYEKEYEHRKGIEIVLVGADSLDTIRRTHAHYFSGSAADPFSELVAG